MSNSSSRSSSSPSRNQGLLEAEVHLKENRYLVTIYRNIIYQVDLEDEMYAEEFAAFPRLKEYISTSKKYIRLKKTKSTAKEEPNQNQDDTKMITGKRSSSVSIVVTNEDEEMNNNETTLLGQDYVTFNNYNNNNSGNQKGAFTESSTTLEVIFFVEITMFGQLIKLKFTGISMGPYQDTANIKTGESGPYWLTEIDQCKYRLTDCESTIASLTETNKSMQETFSKQLEEIQARLTQLEVSEKKLKQIVGLKIPLFYNDTFSSSLLYFEVGSDFIDISSVKPMYGLSTYANKQSQAQPLLNRALLEKVQVDTFITNYFLLPVPLKKSKQHDSHLQKYWKWYEEFTNPFVTKLYYPHPPQHIFTESEDTLYSTSTLNKQTLFDLDRTMLQRLKEYTFPNLKELEITLYDSQTKLQHFIERAVTDLNQYIEINASSRSSFSSSSSLPSFSDEVISKQDIESKETDNNENEKIDTDFAESKDFNSNPEQRKINEKLKKKQHVEVPSGLKITFRIVSDPFHHMDLHNNHPPPLISPPFVQQDEIDKKQTNNIYQEFTLNQQYSDQYLERLHGSTTGIDVKGQDLYESSRNFGKKSVRSQISPKSYSVHKISSSPTFSR